MCLLWALSYSSPTPFSNPCSRPPHISSLVQLRTWWILLVSRHAGPFSRCWVHFPTLTSDGTNLWALTLQALFLYSYGIHGAWSDTQRRWPERTKSLWWPSATRRFLWIVLQTAPQSYSYCSRSRILFWASPAQVLSAATLSGPALLFHQHHRHSTTYSF